MGKLASEDFDVGALVRALDEQAPRARAQLAALLAVLGNVECAELLSRTDEIERSGGLVRIDGSRRSRGGVFFALARERVTERERRIIFGVLARRLERLPLTEITASFDVPGAVRLWGLTERARKPKGRDSAR